MMNILVINGSPKGEKSNTAFVTRSFIKGMNNEAEWINIYDKKIKSCRGCFNCWNETPGKCVFNDDMSEILIKIMSSDLVIWSTPQYAYGMPSHLKAVIDRMLPLATSEQEIDDIGQTHHVFRKKRPPMLLVASCGFADSELNKEPLIMQFKYFFGRESEYIYCAQSPLFSIPSSEPITEAYLKNAEKAGEEFAKNGKISDETHSLLDKPMLPPTIYRKMVNKASSNGDRVG